MTIPSKIRVACVDDHQIVLEGLMQVLSLDQAIEVVGSATNSAQAMALCHQAAPDVVLMDLRLREESGHLLTRRLTEMFPSCRVLVLSSLEGDADVERALAAGASGYLMKGCTREELSRAVHVVHAGSRYLQSEAAASLAEHFSFEGLTDRERDVLAEIARGLKNREIGSRLHIAEDTVKMHVKSILAKLQASDRTEAVTIALRRGIVHL